jgi:alpha-ribazole phosphatase
MTTILLVRHGEVAGNSGEVRTFAGSRDLELTPRGHLQAKAIAERLKDEKIDAIYASTLQRAWRTAEKIDENHNLGVTKLDGWREVDYGLWEGLSEEQINESYAELWGRRVADPWSVAPPEGESYEMLWKRLKPTWDELLSKHPNQTVVVVGHNGSLRVLLCMLLGAPPANARRLQIGNCSLSKVLVGSKGINSNGQETVTTIPGGKLEGPPLVIEYINNTAHTAEI